MVKKKGEKNICENVWVKGKEPCFWEEATTTTTLKTKQQKKGAPTKILRWLLFVVKEKEKRKKKEEWKTTWEWNRRNGWEFYLRWNSKWYRLYSKDGEEELICGH